MRKLRVNFNLPTIVSKRATSLLTVTMSIMMRLVSQRAKKMEITVMKPDAAVSSTMALMMTNHTARTSMKTMRRMKKKSMVMRVETATISNLNKQAKMVLGKPCVPMPLVLAP